MFLIMGVNTRQKLIKELTQICEQCGAYGRFQLYATYQEFNVFFIPLFKWGYKYYVVSTCCGSVYGINEEVAEEIKEGDRETFSQSDLTIHQQGKNRCPYCHALLDKQTPYCPQCGSKL